MKREYAKPTILPIAAACDTASESRELKLRGWFAGDACVFRPNSEDGDYGFINGGGDTVCYHGHVGDTLQS